jgi:predicted alpha/beta-hydrolase family hydrolase
MSRPLILFAPGAGAPSSSPWMTRWAERLAALGDVTRFDYPYMKARRKSPDKLPVLVAAHRAALEEARAGGSKVASGSELRSGSASGDRGARTRPVVLAGKSMGSRVGCHVALEEKVAALVCLGYPLRGARGAMRSEVLLALRTPIIFVQGARDALCPLDALEEVRREMKAPTALHVVEGGNHSLEVGVRALRERGETQDEVDAQAAEAIARFLAEHAR